MDRPRRRRTAIPDTSYRAALLVGVAALAAYLAFLPPGIASSDGQSMLAVTESMVKGHGVSVPANRGQLLAGAWWAAARAFTWAGRQELATPRA